MTGKLTKQIVSVPPRILNRDEDSELVVREGENLTLTCDAKGHPTPHIVWRREDSEDIMVEGRKGDALQYLHLRDDVYCAY